MLLPFESINKRGRSEKRAARVAFFYFNFPSTKNPADFGQIAQNRAGGVFPQNQKKIANFSVKRHFSGKIVYNFGAAFAAFWQQRKEKQWRKNP